jgi:hypothetical protein
VTYKVWVAETTSLQVKVCIQQRHRYEHLFHKSSPSRRLHLEPHLISLARYRGSTIDLYKFGLACNPRTQIHGHLCLLPGLAHLACRFTFCIALHLPKQSFKALMCGQRSTTTTTAGQYLRTGKNMENRLQVSTRATTIYAHYPARYSDAVHAEVLLLVLATSECRSQSCASEIIAKSRE